MALVAYSDSEGSDTEQKPQTTPKPSAKPAVASSTPRFTVDKIQPNKIKVNLSQKVDLHSDGAHEDEPAAKRPRTGAGVFSGFNSMLPAPKRDNLPTSSSVSKGPARKVFSLKTGAEAAFSRESDAELRTLFEEQKSTQHDEEKSTLTTVPLLPKPSFSKPPPPSTSTDPFRFKPMSVARNQKKKRPISGVSMTNAPTKQQLIAAVTTIPDSLDSASVPEPPLKKKISLFSIGTESTPYVPEYEADLESTRDDTYPPRLDGADFTPSGKDEFSVNQAPADTGPESLDTIASDLNLSKAERRQLFGRNANTTATAHNIINFNTDAEYAANQQLIAQGETVQHNPVRGIAPGKHSLRQLVNAASGQKEALEESFAQGKRNKKEAGNKYGW